MTDYLAHGFCFLWDQQLVWLHVISDVLIGIAYYSIPIALLYFILKRRDLPFMNIFTLFAVFIFACGTTHFLAAYTIYVPAYWFEGIVKAVTAAVSIVSAFLFIPVLPKAIALPSLTKALDDIKKLNSTLERQKENFRTLFEQSADAILLVEATGKIADANRVALERYKYSREEFLGMTVNELDSPDDPHTSDDRLKAIRQSGLAIFEVGHISKNGIVIPTEVNARLALIDNTDIIIATCRDITERKKAEAALAAEKERLVVTLRSIGDAVIVTDTEGTVTLMNRVAETLTGWSSDECLGEPLSKVFNVINETTREKCENPVHEVLSTMLIVGLANHTALIRKDGTEIIIADSAAPIRDMESKIIGVVLVFRDITAQYKTEAELQKIQKLESLGLLAGGLAHDFNNLLTGIMGNVGLARMQLDKEHKAYPYLLKAEGATERATGLTKQLLTFAKGGEPIKKKTCIADVVKESVDFALHGSPVKCEYAIPAELWNTEVDSGQMAQVFNNLIINAIHAMPGGGTVHIRFDNVSLAENQVPALPPGDYVQIEFADEGTGIAEKHLSRIFDPYFTTKQQGSGLGLATVFSIINRHGGSIAVKSHVGKGTIFRICLPATRDLSINGNKQKDHMPSGRGRILVMDDEAIVKDTAREILAALGYEVEFADDGFKAVELYTKALAGNKPFSIVVMDLTIPGSMGGKEAIQKLLEIDADARVIVSSGYSTDPVMSNYGKYGFKGVITKPYNIAQLSQTISRVLAM